MQIELSEQTLTWQRRVLDYVERELIPWEVTAELNGGELPRQIMQRIQGEAMTLGLPGMDAPVAQGGLGLSRAWCSRARSASTWKRRCTC